MIDDSKNRRIENRGSILDFVRVFGRRPRGKECPNCPIVFAELPNRAGQGGGGGGG